MGNSVDARRNEELELLEAEREVKFEKIIEDLFCNESSGLHVFFQRSPNNSAFIDSLVEIEHKLSSKNIFDALKDEDGFVNAEEVLDHLLAIFRSLSATVANEKSEVFDEAHITGEELMAHVRRAFVKIASMFEDSSFPAEEYFLARIAPNHAGTLPKTKTLPPESLLDIKELEVPANDLEAAPMPSTSRSATGKLITMSFDQEAAIHSMIKEVGLRMTADSFSDEAIARATMEQIRRVAEIAIRTTSRSIVRRANPKTLEDLIHRATLEIITKLQDLAVQHPDKPVSKIIVYFYSPGKEKYRADLERTIHEEVERYYRKIHTSPATVMPGARIPTKRPSGKPVPEPAVHDDAGMKHVSAVKTQRPPNFAPVIDQVTQDVRAGINIPPAATPSDLGADDEPTMVSPAPKIPSNPPPEETGTGTPRPLPDLYSDDETHDGETNPVTAAPTATELLKSTPLPIQSAQFQPAPVPKIQPSPLASTRPLEEVPLPSSSKDILKNPPVISDRPSSAPVPRQPAQQPIGRPTPVELTSAPELWPSPVPLSPKAAPMSETDVARQHPLPPAPPKKQGFFSRAKKWVVGATLAAAAAMGVYTVTQTKSPSFETDNVPAASTAGNSDTSKKSVTAPVSTSPLSSPAVSMTPAPGPTAAPTVDVKSSPTAHPQPTTAPDAHEQAPQVAAVLSSSSYALGSAEGAKPFTGTASLAEGGVDATPFAPSLKTAVWYENQKKSAEALLKIYDSHKSQLDKGAVAFIEKNEKLLRDLAAQTDFTPATFKAAFEGRYASADILGSNGLYNNLLAFQRIVNLYGGDTEKIVKDKTVIKFTVGSKVMAPEQRFAKAVLLSPGTKYNNSSGTDNPEPAPTKNPHGQNHLNQQPKVPQPQYGFNNPAHNFSEGVDLGAIDAAWDTIAEQHASTQSVKEQRRAELYAKVDRLFANAKLKNVQVPEIKDSSDDTPEIEVRFSEDDINDDSPEIDVSEVDLLPHEAVELDRREALLERGEMVVPPVDEGGTGSVLLALENGFMKECQNGDQMDRVQQRVAKIRMSSLESYEVLTDGKIYAKISPRDLEDLRRIIA